MSKKSEQPRIFSKLVMRNAFFRVLEEFEIQQLEIHRRTSVLQHFDPERFTTVAPSNITDWGKYRHDAHWRTLESMIFALAFPPTSRAFDRFFDLLRESFDLRIPAQAIRKLDDDQSESDRSVRGE